MFSVRVSRKIHMYIKCGHRVFLWQSKRSFSLVSHEVDKCFDLPRSLSFGTGLGATFGAMFAPLRCKDILSYTILNVFSDEISCCLEFSDVEV